MLGAVDLVQPATTPALFESGTVNMDSADPPRVVVSAVGSYSCCEVFLSRPTGSGAEYAIKIYGRVGDARVFLAGISASDVPYTADGAREGAIAFSIRGRPCSAFEVELEPADEILGVQLFLQAWHADLPPETVTGAERVVTVKQGAPATSSGRWPVYLSTGAAAQGLVNTPLFTRLSDGAAAQGVVGAPLFVRLSDGTAASGSTTNPVALQVTASTRVTFSRGSDRVLTLAGAAASNTVLGALWNPSSTKRVELQRFEVSFWGASTSGAVRLRARRITATPTLPVGGGGATLTAENHDSADAGPSAQLFVNANAPTWGTSADFLMVTLKPAEAGRYAWAAADAGKPIVLRQNEGFEVRVVTETAMASAMNFGINMQWVEI